MKKMTKSEYYELGKTFYELFSESMLDITVEPDKKNIEIEMERILGLIDYVQIKQDEIKE